MPTEEETGTPGDGVFRVGVWVVDPAAGRISDGDTTHHLRPKVMELLVVLARRPGVVLSKQQLLDTVWPDAVVPFENLTGDPGLDILGRRTAEVIVQGLAELEIEPTWARPRLAAAAMLVRGHTVGFDYLEEEMFSHPDGYDRLAKQLLMPLEVRMRELNPIQQRVLTGHAGRGRPNCRSRCPPTFDFSSRGDAGPFSCLVSSLAVEHTPDTHYNTHYERMRYENEHRARRQSRGGGFPAYRCTDQCLASTIFVR